MSWGTARDSKVTRFDSKRPARMVLGDCGGNQTLPGLIFTAYRVISGVYYAWTIIWGLTRDKIIVLLQNAEGY